MENPEFKLWHDTHALRNPATADGYLNNVVRWTQRTGTDPITWIKQAKENPVAFDALTQAMVNEMVRRQAGQDSIQTYLIGLRSWMDWNRAELGRRLIIGRTPKRPKASLQRIPSRATLRRVLDHAPTQTRCILAFRCFGGLRPGILGNLKGTDGLVLGDLEGLAFVDGAPVVEEDFLVVRVRAELSKNGKPFFTLIGQEGIDYLLAFLRERLAKGEALTPESPVIIQVLCRSGQGRFLRRSSIGDQLRRAMDAAGVPESTYIWRHYFKTQLLPAQGKKGLTPEYPEFWMGHFNGIQGTYSFDKGLPEEVMKDVITQYRTIAVGHLETRSNGDDGRDALHVASALLQSVGLTDDDLQGIDLEDPDHDAIQVLVQERLEARVGALISEHVQDTRDAPAVAVRAPQQALVGLEAVAAYLDAGWTWRTDVTAPSGRALMEAPHGTPKPGAGSTIRAEELLVA